MATAESVKAKLQNLITLANNTTGNTDATLTQAVNALIAGFGQGGGGDTPTVDTSPRIAQTGYGLNRNGVLVEDSSLCVTDYYPIPEGYIGKVTGVIFYDNEADGAYNENNAKLCVYDGETPTGIYWSYSAAAQVYTGDVGYPQQIGLYYASGWPTGEATLRLALVTKYADYDYLYFTDTGDVIFAGKHSPYYGMTNVYEIPGGGEVGASATGTYVLAEDSSMLQVDVSDIGFVPDLAIVKLDETGITYEDSITKIWVLLRAPQLLDEVGTGYSYTVNNIARCYRGTQGTYTAIVAAITTNYIGIPPNDARMRIRVNQSASSYQIKAGTYNWYAYKLWEDA